jgi:hypothetical protein
MHRLPCLVYLGGVDRDGRRHSVKELAEVEVVKPAAHLGLHRVGVLQARMLVE